MDLHTEVYDLLILVDATPSMNETLKSLQISLPQIISISTLTDCFDRIGVLAYRDYADIDITEWSGWLQPSSDSEDHQRKILRMAGELKIGTGGDWPEATKTGLARAYELMRDEAITIILHYTDAPPHTFGNGSLTNGKSYLKEEQDALTDLSSYGGFGPTFLDWVSVANVLSKRTGNKRSQVFSLLSGTYRANFPDTAYYNYLTTMTTGACVHLDDSVPSNISQVTIELLLAWMGTGKPGSENAEFPAKFTRYIDVKGIKTLVDEIDPHANKFFATPSFSARHSTGPQNIAQVKLTSDILKKHMPKKKTPTQNFAERYSADEKYKALVVDQLKKLIDEDVSAISLNAVFGSLWRKFCNDRANSAREELITAFSEAVNRIDNADEQTRMKIWLEESYDYTAEVLEIINSVPKSQRFPCVCLDPTVVFSRELRSTNDDGLTRVVTDDNEELSKPITSFRRDELLDISRSCDYKILRRLGRVLTRLTYINSAEDMPAHITAASETDVPRIPMALATAENKRQFWRILLHIVVPGTMLSARPAALLAALAIRLGIKPLLDVADSEITPWRNRWNNIEIPETWNIGCLTLLLEADEAFQKRHKKAETSIETLLTDEDRLLFEHLVSYKMLELNLDTTLTALVGWTPEKTKVSIGPVAVCRSCQYPRSVTIMGPKGKCGHCLYTQYKTQEIRKTCITAQVEKEDNEQSRKTWVECNIRACRAQYVVYHVENLNVKPKCHFCREGKIAPVVECSQCLNRIIWPLKYRPVDLDLKQFRCYACNEGRKTVVETQATANMVSKENGPNWLLRNEQKLVRPFDKRSLFQTISNIDGSLEDFCDRVELFPAVEKLTLRGKLIRNTPALTDELRAWVSRRRIQSGTCSLCASSKRKTELQRACGRTGCEQRICRECLNGWYGINSPGQIINFAALCCPFCRRAPAANTLSKYGMGIQAVADLQKAADEAGTWISAWCSGCDHAKRVMERVCAAGAPPEFESWNLWRCEACKFGEKFKAKKYQATLKKCPGCGWDTEKEYGCNHMTCVCGTHWCWLCGTTSEAGSIYAHMRKAHGSWFD